MHDPCTVAFEIKYPWWRHRPWTKAARKRAVEDHDFAWRQMSEQEQAGRDRMWKDGYRDTAVTIWHVDPEKDGSDDSCGWSYPKLTIKQRERLHNAAWSEGRNPYFLRCRSKEWLGTRAEAETLYRGLVLLVADVLDIPVSYDEAARVASRRINTPDCIDPANVFCYLPGYHTNFPDDEADGPPYQEERARRRQDAFEDVMYSVAKSLLRARRPWWRHPRWHVWHWRVQIHFTQTLKRWAFSRCCKCGKRFLWGYSPVSNSWNSNGPRWFRGEKNVMHHECSGMQVGTPAQPQPSEA